MLLILATLVVMVTGQDLTTTVPGHFYPLGPTHGDTEAPVNDDGSTPELFIAIPFPYFDQLHPSLFVNTNGAVSFLNVISQFTPDPFPLGNDRRLIAPFWADVDTRVNTGRVYYRETQDVAILDRCSADVHSGFVDQTRFQAVWALVVTWYNVTHYGGSSSTPLNTFQALLITNGRHSFTMFNYGEIIWTFGTASNGIHAQAGFNAGDSLRHFTIPGSRTAAIADVETTSNVGLPGRWLFRVDEANVMSGGCNTEGVLAVGPRFASLLGGKMVTVAGPCFNVSTDDVVCRFVNITVPGQIIDDNRASCVIPLTMTVGRKPFSLSVDGGLTYSHTGVFWFVEEDDDDHTVKKVDEVAWARGGLYDNLVIQWNHNILPSASVDVDFVIISDEADGSFTTESVSLFPRAPNTGELTLPDRLQYAQNLTFALFGAIRVRESSAGLQRQSVWSPIQLAQWYMNRLIYEVALRNGTTTSRKRRGFRDWFGNAADALKDVADAVVDLVDDTVSDVKQAVSDVANGVKEAVASVKCFEWYLFEKLNPPDFEEVGPSPCTMAQAISDPRFKADKACNMGKGCKFHPGAYHCVRSAQPSPNGASQQACYDRAGNLLPFDKGGGTYDRSHADGNWWPPVIPLLDHFSDDVLPYMLCCEWSNNCDKYEEMRPTDDCDGYQPPRPARTAGDPHFVTMDGLRYTFNGIGEFVLLDVDAGSLVIQARAEQFEDSGGSVRATVWTAITMKSSSSDKVQVSVSEVLGLAVLVNGLSATFDDLPSQQYEGVLVQQVEASRKFRVRFASGVTVQVTQDSGVMSILPVLTPAAQGKTKGLLGVWDGNDTNDFTNPDGSIVPVTATPEQIHNDFGLKWRVPEVESLFTYPVGRTYDSYQDPSFIPVFVPTTTDPAVTQRALEICASDIQCQFDYILTRNEAVANSTAASNLEYASIVQDVIPVVTCGFPEMPDHGSGNATNGPEGAVVVFVCDEGYVLLGSASRQCMEHGQWSGQPTRCIGSATELPCRCSGSGEVDVDTYDGASLGIFTSSKTLLSRWNEDPDDVCKFQIRTVTKADINNVTTALHYDWLGFAIGVHPKNNAKEKLNIMFAQDTAGKAVIGIRGHGYRAEELLPFVDGVSVVTYDATSCEWTVKKENDHLMTLESSCCPYAFTWQPRGVSSQWQLSVGSQDGTMQGMCGDCNSNAVDDWRKCPSGPVVEDSAANKPVIAESCIEGKNQGEAFPGGMRLSALV